MSEDLVPEDEDNTESTPILLTMVFTMIIIFVAYVYQNLDVMLKIGRFLPNASGNILLGMVVGFFISLEEDVEKMFSFHEDFFFLVMLPPIIFASGFNLRKDFFFLQLWDDSVICFCWHINRNYYYCLIFDVVEQVQL